MDSKSQYQHFVPQFLLRNFAHDFVPPADTNGKTKKKHSKKRPYYDKGNLRKYWGDKVVYNINLCQTPYMIDESPVKRILGQLDMYSDHSKPTQEEKNELEMRLSKIECEAMAVFRRFTKFYEAGSPAVSLSRMERNLVRKFLFLLKFRGSGFYKRFSHENVEDYNAEDKEVFQKYMRDHNLTRPVEVWLRSIKLIIDLHMDPEREWIQEIRSKMYRGDAEWFVMHTQRMYMALCTPQDARDEFVLTDNSYSIFEGPNHFVQDVRTGEVGQAGHANFHDFAPISSKLMLILRSSLLPVPEEDADPEARRRRENFRYACVDDVFGPGTKSTLEDLPISKPRNSYSRIIDGRTVANPDFSGKHSQHDKFYFRFFPLKTEHVHKINKILLQNSFTCSRIVFGSEKALLRSLEWYMKQPKIVTGTGADLQEKHLQGPTALMKIKDYNRYRKQFLDYREYLDTIAECDDKSSMVDNFFARYQSLSNIKGKSGFNADMQQSGLMWQLRIKIDWWSLATGVDMATRVRNRRLLTEEYKLMPPSRFWLYIKRLRLSMMSPENLSVPVQPLVQILGNPQIRNGPEDVFAQDAVKKYVRPDRLNHLIYATAMADPRISKFKSDVWRPARNAVEEVMRYRFLFSHALALPGRIRDCGICEIQNAAVRAEKEVVRRQLHLQGPLNNPVFRDDDRIEMASRILVRPQFLSVLAGMDEKVVRQLKDVFFTYTYMTPPTK